MRNRNKGRRLAIAGVLGASIIAAPACSVHHGYGRSCSTYWYEDVGVALVAAAVFVLAACSGGHNELNLSGSFAAAFLAAAASIFVTWSSWDSCR